MIPAVAAFGGTYYPGTPEGYVSETETLIAQLQGRSRDGDRYVSGNRWNGGGLAGDPLAFTWSLVPDGLGIPSQAGEPAANSVLFQTLDAQFADAAGGGDPIDVWRPLIIDAFTGWANVSGCRFGSISDPNVNPDPMAMDNPNDDDGAPWGDETVSPGPINDPAVNDRGDIRIAMKSIDGPGGLCAVASGPDFGDIVLDADENWADDTDSFRFMINCLTREIGTAIGLKAVCPDTLDAWIMEPTLNLFIEGPQHDDIRAVNRLYGDSVVISSGGFVANNTLGTAYFPDELAFQGSFSSLDAGLSLSIDKAGEPDYFGITLSGLGEMGGRIFVTVTPDGQTYPTGPVGGGGECSAGTPVNSLAVQNLRVTLLDNNGAVLNTQDTAPIGEPEEATFDVPEDGTYFILVEGDGADDDVQVYLLDVVIDEDISVPGFGDTTELKQVANRIEAIPLYDLGFTGSRAVVVNMEGGHIWDGHVAYFGRDIPQISWMGAGAVDPRVTDHATGVGGISAGSEFDTFRGIAYDASLASAAVATTYFPGSMNFQFSLNAIYFALFGLTDPSIATSVGMPGPATVFNSSWGNSGDLIAESALAYAYDAAATMRGVSIVVSAGDGGRTDNTGECFGTGGDTVPGGSFIGSRTIDSPGTAWNVITVGASSSEWRNSGGGTGVVDVLHPDRVAAFSSRGPIDSFNWQRDNLGVLNNTRSGVDILAPGTGRVQMTGGGGMGGSSCPYPGDWINGTELNIPWIDPDDDPLNPVTNNFFTVEFADGDDFIPGPGMTPSKGGVSGSSFAAPVVAGAIALLQDAGLAQDPPLEINNLVMKSVLLTGAAKLPGWSNTDDPGAPQLARDGDSPTGGPDGNLLGTFFAAQTTEQPLDLAQGAGTLDLQRTAAIYLTTNPNRPSLRDSPLTVPGVATIRQPLIRDIPVPFPRSPSTGGDGGGTSASKKQPTAAPLPNSVRDIGVRPLDNEDRSLSRIELAKAIRMAKRASNMSPVSHSHFADDDPEIDPQEPPGPVGGGGTAGGGFIDPTFGDPLPDGSPFTGRCFERAVVLPGPIEGGTIGWDYGMIGVQFVRSLQDSGLMGHIDYRIGPVIPNQPGEVTARDAIIATLVWNRETEVKVPSFNNPNFAIPGFPTKLELEDLDLQLFRDGDEDLGGPALFQSGEPDNEEHNNVEHVFWVTDTGLNTGFFILRVRWDQRLYDVTRKNCFASVPFAVSWVVVDYDEDDYIDGRMDNLSTENSPTFTLNDITSLIPKLGQQMGETDYDPSSDHDSNGVIDVNDIVYMISHLSV